MVIIRYLVPALLILASWHVAAQPACPKGEKRLRPTDECIPAVLFNYLYCLEKSGGGKVEIKTKSGDEKTKSIEIGVAGAAGSVVLKGKGSVGFKNSDAEKAVREIEERLDPTLAQRCHKLASSAPADRIQLRQTGYVADYSEREKSGVLQAGGQSKAVTGKDAGVASVAVVGRCRSDHVLLKSMPAGDAAVMLDTWPVPLVWKTGQPDLVVPITNEESFLNRRLFELDGIEATDPQKRSPSEEALRLFSLDPESRKVIQQGLGNFAWGARYHARFGLVKTYPRPPDGGNSAPYFDVRFLSEWIRDVFNREMIQDFYSKTDKKYCRQEAKWLSAAEMMFPSFLYGEFILITRDGQAVYRLKVPGKDRSKLADIQGKTVFAVSVETAVRVEPVGADGDMVYDLVRPSQAGINLNRLVLRALKSDIGIDSISVNKIRVHGLAFQADTLNSSIVGVVHTENSCEEVIAQAAKSERVVYCMSPRMGHDALKGRGEFALGDESKFAWHSTSRLRIRLWQGL